MLYVEVLIKSPPTAVDTAYYYHYVLLLASALCHIYKRQMFSSAYCTLTRGRIWEKPVRYARTYALWTLHGPSQGGVVRGRLYVQDVY
jgi:hypothetical protein